MSDTDDLMRSVMNVQKRAAGFANSMREQGIHLGWGSPPHCVVDGESWPCAHERSNQAPTS